MTSKLKIIVDHPCDVYCDYECKGQATPNSIFVIELRKGTYYLEFKINDLVHESLDYTIDSSEQDDLLRVTLLSHISFSHLLIDIQSKTRRDNNNESLFYGDIYVKLKTTDKAQNVKYNSFDYSFLMKDKPSKFYIICEEKTYEAYDEKESVYRLELPIVFHKGELPRNISIDVEWLHCHYGDYNGKLAVYMDAITNIYYIKSGKIIDTKTIDAGAGFLYNISSHYALTERDHKFGIYDIINNKSLCQNKFDELYCARVEYHGDIYHGFFTADKYSVELNGKTGIVDIEGNLLLPCIYDEAHPCYLGYIVKRNRMLGISHNGEEPSEWYEDIFATHQTSYGITKAHFGGYAKNDIESYDYLCSCIIYFKKNNKYGYWDVTGKKSTLLYDEIETDYLFGTSLARLIKTRIGNKIGFIDCYGQEIIPCMYEDIYIARNENPSLALYCDYKLLIEHKIKTKYLSINEQEAKESGLYDVNLPIGHLLGSHIDYHVTNYIAKRNNKLGVCTIEGNILISFIYDFIDGLPYDYFLVEKDGLFGILKSDQEIVFPIKYTDREELEKAFAWTIY